MKLEEMSAKWDNISEFHAGIGERAYYYSPRDEAHAIFAREYIPKLIAVAKAAKHCLAEEKAYRGTYLTSELELGIVLTELEKEK